MATLSNQVRALIDRSGESRYSICKACDIGEPNMSRFMAGDSGLSLGALDRLAEHLNWKLTAAPRRRTTTTAKRPKQRKG